MDKTIDPTGSNSQEALVNALKEMDEKSSAKAEDPPQSKRSRRNNAGDKKQFLKIKYPDFDVNCSSEESNNFIKSIIMKMLIRL